MKILVVMGSPRKGQTFQAVQKVESIVREGAPDAEFEYLWLKDANLGQCRGCHACVLFGEQKCPLKDDTLPIEARMLAADGIILATPVYTQQVSYLMKIFLDRYAYIWHRPRMFGKFVLGVVTGGGQFKSTLGYLKENAEAWGATWAGGLGVPHFNALQPGFQARVVKDIRREGQKFAAAVAAGRTPAPSLGRMLWFRMWRINARALKAENPTDFRYWTEKGWFNQEYYTRQTLPLAYRLLARAIEPVMLRVMRGVYVGY